MAFLKENRQGNNPNIAEAGRATRFQPGHRHDKETQDLITEKAKATKKEKRDLMDLLNTKLKGRGVETLRHEIEQMFEGRAKVVTIADALHLAQLYRGVKYKDTFAYSALMQVSGMAKPAKTDITTNGESLNNGPALDYSKLDDEELETLKLLLEKCRVNTSV